MPVLNEGLIRLVRALRDHQPESVADFLGFAALQMRRWLLDETRRQRRAAGRGGDGRDGERPEQGPATDAPDPKSDLADLAKWTEFHEQVGRLPEDLRQVMGLYWYQGHTQQEVADILGVNQGTVSRRLGEAVSRLPFPPDA
jgi:RNA polymerase sigma factor (sigma-70 family)